MIGASDSNADVINEHYVFKNAVHGIHAIYRVDDRAIEDFLLIEQDVVENSIGYEVSLENISSIRLIEGTLEFLDKDGVPRFRMTQPFLIDAKGAYAGARVSVNDCKYDDNPAAPWGRSVAFVDKKTCVIEVSWDSSEISYPVLLDPTWSTTDSIAYPRANFTSTQLINGRVLIAGGFGSSGYITQSELFDPGTETFSITGSLNTTRQNHAASRMGNGQVLVTGGKYVLGEHWNTRSAEIYNPSTGVWSNTGQMIHGRRDHTVTLLSNGHVLITGGWGEEDALNSSEIYTLSSGAFSAGPLMNVPRDRHTATPISGARALIVGGNIGSGVKYEIYDSGQFYGYNDDFVNPIYGHSAVLLQNGDVLISGGAPSGTSRSYIFRASSNSWVQVGSMIHVRVHHAASLLSDGTVLVTGGRAGSAQLDSAELFDPIHGTWTEIEKMMITRSEHSSTRLPSGKVLLVGGVSTGGQTSLAHLYTHSRQDFEYVDYKYSPGCLVPQYGSSCALEDRETELWARFYRPSILPTNESRPLVVFIHGNGGSCSIGSNPRVNNNYSYHHFGVCPSGYEIVPVHLGFGYVAEELARRGYFVLSINATRGFFSSDDFDYDKHEIAKAQLMVLHINQLSKWNLGLETTPSNFGFDLQGLVDFGKIILVGHSRGAVAASYANRYIKLGGSGVGTLPEPMSVVGIFSIGQAEHEFEDRFESTIHPANIKWVSLSGMCDSAGGQASMWMLDRLYKMTETVPAFKSSFIVWGANHNFYNTEWEVADGSCGGHDALWKTGEIGSAAQRQTLLTPLLNFVMANTDGGLYNELNNIFDPKYPALSYPRVHRSYLDSIYYDDRLVLDDFSASTGMSSSGFANLSNNVSVVHTYPKDSSVSSPGMHAQQDPIREPGLPSHPSHNALRATWAKISWTNASEDRFFQSNWSASGTGVDISSYETLDIRLDRAPTLDNVATSTNFQIRLVGPNDMLSNPVPVANYASLVGPVGMGVTVNSPHRTYLQTARIPLSSFSGVSLDEVQGVRFEFSNTTSGTIYVDDIRASRPAP